MKHFLILFFCVGFVIVIQAQNATIITARKSIYTGFFGPIKVFIDGKLVCQVKNNRYSVHSVNAGTHKISMQMESKEYKDKTNAVEFEAKPGETYYFKAELKRLLSVEEITSNTWKKFKEKLKQDDCL